MSNETKKDIQQVEVRRVEGSNTNQDSSRYGDGYQLYHTTFQEFLQELEDAYQGYERDFFHRG